MALIWTFTVVSAMLSSWAICLLSLPAHGVPERRAEQRVIVDDEDQIVHRMISRPFLDKPYL
jgi:hypothetical protein